MQKLLIICAIALLCACGSNSPSGYDAVSVEGATAVRVNGENIYLSDVELEAVAQGMIAPGDPFDATHSDYQMILDQLIDQRLMAQEAERLGLAEDAAAKRRLAAARERILGNLLVENMVAGQVTDAKIEQMYAEQVALQQVDDEVSISHILLASEEDAKAILKQIADGATFESLVFNASLDTSTRMENGDLGYVSPNNQPDPFGAIIANTQVGDVSEPFKTADGWHIVKVKDRRTKPPKTREEMRPEIVTFLTLSEISKILRQLRAEATIQQGEAGAYEPLGEPLFPSDARPTPDPQEAEPN